MVFPFRFSHSPLIDDDDDEEEEAKEPMLNEAFGTTFDSSCNLKLQTSVCHIKVFEKETECSFVLHS